MHVYAIGCVHDKWLDHVLVDDVHVYAIGCVHDKWWLSCYGDDVVVVYCVCLCCLLMFMIGDGYHVLDWWCFIMYDVIVTCVECYMILWCACIYILVVANSHCVELVSITNNRSRVIMGGEAGFMSGWLWTNRCWWLSSCFGTTCIESAFAFCVEL